MQVKEGCCTVLRCVGEKVSQKSIVCVFYVTFEVVEDDFYFLFHVCSDLRTCWSGKVSMKIPLDDRACCVELVHQGGDLCFGQIC